MFNRDLFYELCDKHGVEISANLDKCMININDNIQNLSSKTVLSLITDYNNDDTFIYNNCYLSCGIENSMLIYNYDPFLTLVC